MTRLYSGLVFRCRPSSGLGIPKSVISCQLDPSGMHEGDGKRVGGETGSALHDKAMPPGRRATLRVGSGDARTALTAQAREAPRIRLTIPLPLRYDGESARFRAFPYERIPLMTVPPNR